MQHFYFRAFIASSLEFVYMVIKPLAHLVIVIPNPALDSFAFTPAWLEACALDPYVNVKEPANEAKFLVTDFKLRAPLSLNRYQSVCHSLSLPIGILSTAQSWCHRKEIL
jgi:hypothetical protein